MRSNRKLAILVLGVALVIGYFYASTQQAQVKELSELTPQELFEQGFNEGGWIFAEDVKFEGANPDALVWRGNSYTFDWIRTGDEYVYDYKYTGDVVYTATATDPDFRQVLEKFFAVDSPYRGLTFARVEVRQQGYAISADGTIYIYGDLVGSVVLETPEGYRFWETFAFLPTHAQIDRIFAVYGEDDPETVAWKVYLKEILHADHDEMVRKAQEGRLASAYDIQAEIFQTILEESLFPLESNRHLLVSPFCRLYFSCADEIVHRHEDGTLRLELLSEEDRRDVVYALRNSSELIDELIEDVQIVSVSHPDENLDVRWTSYYLSVKINGTWYALESTPFKVFRYRI